jgi:hypothetical protein
MILMLIGAALGVLWALKGPIKAFCDELTTPPPRKVIPTEDARRRHWKGLWD